MSLAEFNAMADGFNKNQKILILQQEGIAFWQAGAIAGFALGGKEFKPDEYWESRPSNRKEKPQETDDELFELAKEKGVEVPEGK